MHGQPQIRFKSIYITLLHWNYFAYLITTVNVLFKISVLMFLFADISHRYSLKHYYSGSETFSDGSPQAKTEAQK